MKATAKAFPSDPDAAAFVSRQKSHIQTIKMPIDGKVVVVVFNPKAEDPEEPAVLRATVEYYSHSKDGLRNGSFYRCLFWNDGEYAIGHFINGDYMGQIASAKITPIDCLQLNPDLQRFEKAEAEALIPQVCR
jgi:hypothetical protein